MNAADYPRIPLDEALESLGRMPAFLDRAISGRSGAELRARAPGGGEFSLVEHACHLRDLEREGYRVRVRRVLAEDRPALAGFPGDVIASQRDYPSQDAAAAAADFALARSEVLGMLRGLAPEALCRPAFFDGREISLADVVSMMVEHDRGHRAEIEALVAALGPA